MARWGAGGAGRGPLDILTRVRWGRQAAGGGDGRQEDEGAGRRHLVQDGREVEVSAAGEEGGRALSPQPWGPAQPWPPPAQERGGKRRTGGGRGCLLAQVPPSPSSKGQTDEGMERRTEEKS